jgi:hypothetical protein
LKRTGKGVDAATQAVLERGIAVTALIITGNTKSFQGVYFPKKQKRPMTGL